jgi:hypothetical protein
MSARKVIGATATDHHSSKVHMDYDPMIDNDDDDHHHGLKTGYMVPTTPTRNEDRSKRSLSHSAERKKAQQRSSRLSVETSSFSQSDDFQRIFDGENTTITTTPKSDNKNRLLSPFSSPILVSPFASPRNNNTHQPQHHHKSSVMEVETGPRGRSGVSGGSVGSSRGSSSSKKLLEGGPEIYYVQQRYGYFSILFSVAQTAILVLMMKNCGVAPFSINPMLGPYPDALSEWGAKNAVNILDDDEWWRLLTPIMLHAGVIHLLCNVAVQLETGAFFEREWGSRNWIIIYLTSAVGSSILSVIFMPNAISVGSSGAVMGLFGGKLAEIICRYCDATHTKEEKIGHQVRQEQCGAVLCSVTLVMLFSFIPYGAYYSVLNTFCRLARYALSFYFRENSSWWWMPMAVGVGD